MILGVYRPRETDRRRMIAMYFLRHKLCKRGRGLIDRMRKVMYPRARKDGPVYPSFRPSRPNLPKIIQQ